MFKAWKVLSSKLQIEAILTAILLFVNSILELIGLAVIIPILTVILEENAIANNQYLYKIYNLLNLEQESIFLALLLGVIVLLFISKNLVSLFITYKQSRFSFSLYSFYSTRLHQYFYSKGFIFFNQNNSNEIVKDINQVSLWYAKLLITPMLTLLNEVLVLIMIVVAIVVYNVQIIFILGLTVVPVAYLFYRVVRNFAKRYTERRNDLAAELYKILYQSIAAYVDVKINNNSSWFFNQYKKGTEEVSEIEAKLHVLSLSSTKVLESSFILALAVITLYGILYLENRSDLIILLGVFGIAAYRVLPSINRIMNALISIKSYQFTFNTIKLSKHLTGDKKLMIDTKEQLAFKSSIKFEDISYGYSESTLILMGINLEINKGETIGFIGESGAGKTTFFNVLLGLLDNYNGNINIDDVRLDLENIGKWRNNIGYVQQEVFLIDGSIRDNIIFGSFELASDKERMKKAIEISSLRKLIDSLPDGIETHVGERGSKLSGGQRQRIGIARALFSGAEVLLFDEATSALDNDTENEITESIKKLSEHNFTILIIAHRYTTLKYCDYIVEFNDGQISRQYTYKELTQIKT
jgi:ATP-binding cassette, subfamily B, bacterial PglK